MRLEIFGFLAGKEVFFKIAKLSKQERKEVLRSPLVCQGSNQRTIRFQLAKIEPLLNPNESER